MTLGRGSSVRRITTCSTIGLQLHCPLRNITSITKTNYICEWKHVPLQGNVRQMASSCECFLAFTNMPRIVYWIPTLALALLACTIRTMERCICILQFALQWECDMFVVELKRRDRPPALGICQRKKLLCESTSALSRPQKMAKRFHVMDKSNSNMFRDVPWYKFCIFF